MDYCSWEFLIYDLWLLDWIMRERLCHYTDGCMKTNTNDIMIIDIPWRKAYGFVDAIIEKYKEYDGHNIRCGVLKIIC